MNATTIPPLSDVGMLGRHRPGVMLLTDDRVSMVRGGSKKRFNHGKRSAGYIVYADLRSGTGPVRDASTPRTLGTCPPPRQAGVGAKRRSLASLAFKGLGGALHVPSGKPTTARCVGAPDLRLMRTVASQDMGAEVVVLDTAALAPGETSSSSLEKENHSLKAQVMRAVSSSEGI